MIFLVPLMFVSMGEMIFGWLQIPVPTFFEVAFSGGKNSITFALTQLFLLLPILYFNRKFFISGFKSLFSLHPDMNSLVALGAFASVFYSSVILFKIGVILGNAAFLGGSLETVIALRHDLYFESAGTILTLVTLGKWLEAKSKSKTGEQVQKLVDLSPKTANLLQEDGTEIQIDLRKRFGKLGCQYRRSHCRLGQPEIYAGTVAHTAIVVRVVRHEDHRADSYRRKRLDGLSLI